MRFEVSGNELMVVLEGGVKLEVPGDVEHVKRFVIVRVDVGDGGLAAGEDAV